MCTGQYSAFSFPKLFLALIALVALIVATVFAMACCKTTELLSALSLIAGVFRWENVNKVLTF